MDAEKHYFPIKLWTMVNDPTDKTITWSATGKSIIFTMERLKKYLTLNKSVFKTKNAGSFIRQLNMYGFIIVKEKLKAQMENNYNLREYRHNLFQKKRLDLVPYIVRRGRQYDCSFSLFNARLHLHEVLTRARQANHGKLKENVKYVSILKKITPETSQGQNTKDLAVPDNTEVVDQVLEKVEATSFEYEEHNCDFNNNESTSSLNYPPVAAHFDEATITPVHPIADIAPTSKHGLKLMKFDPPQDQEYEVLHCQLHDLIADTYRMLNEP